MVLIYNKIRIANYWTNCTIVTSRSDGHVVHSPAKLVDDWCDFYSIVIIHALHECYICIAYSLCVPGNIDIFGQICVVFSDEHGHVVCAHDYAFLLVMMCMCNDVCVFQHFTIALIIIALGNQISASAIYWSYLSIYELWCGTDWEQYAWWY